MLQGNTISFKPELWERAIEAIKSEFSKDNYIYVILKGNNLPIKALYIGKSKAKELNRLKQHYEGLSQLTDEFYARMSQLFFDSDKDLPLVLVLFKWNRDRVVKNILPFDLKANISNAEAMLISYFALLYPKAILNHNYVSRQKWRNLRLYTNLLNSQITPSKLTILHEVIGTDLISLWNDWCKWFLTEANALNPNLSENQNLIPLLECDHSSKEIVIEDIHGAKILKRNPLMIQQVISAVKEVEKSYVYYAQSDQKQLKDRNNEKAPFFIDGLIYMAYVLRSDIKSLPEFAQSSFSADYIPIYIGKTETLGRNGGFSENLKSVSLGKNMQYFARWGHDKARHIGGLSYCFFKRENPYKSTDYESWIKIMFDEKGREICVPILKIYFPLH